MDNPSRIKQPFGPALLSAQVNITVLPAESCLSPLDFFERLHHSGQARGAVLMESAAQGAPAGIRSVVIPMGALRLVIRGGRAEMDS